MAINFQQVFDRIHEIGIGANLRSEQLDKLRAQTLDLLENWSDKATRLNEKLELAGRADPALRCAIPLVEPLDTHRPAGPSDISSLTLIAADGSQVVPDRHAALLFGLINVGTIVIPPGPDLAPIILTESTLSFDDEVFNWTDGLVALKRDLAERKKLLAVAKDYPLPVLTLTDGPLQLWESHEGDQGMGYEKSLQEYLSVLSQLQERAVITAGYVDKPASNLLVRLMEVALTPEPEINEIHDRNPLRGVTDLWLFDGLLLPGERSAIFALQARAKAVYRGSLALHFFYLNVGQPGHPKSVRVEIPAWVSQDGSKLDLLQAALLDQSAILGARPYPYILHRAHEAAVVSFQEKQQIEQMLSLELRKSGGQIGESSGKQASKDSSHGARKRYA